MPELYVAELRAKQRRRRMIATELQGDRPHVVRSLAHLLRDDLPQPSLLGIAIQNIIVA